MTEIKTNWDQMHKTIEWLAERGIPLKKAYPIIRDGQEAMYHGSYGDESPDEFSERTGIPHTELCEMIHGVPYSDIYTSDSSYDEDEQQQCLQMVFCILELDFGHPRPAEPMPHYPISEDAPRPTEAWKLEWNYLRAWYSKYFSLVNLGPLKYYYISKQLSIWYGISQDEHSWDYDNDLEENCSGINKAVFHFNNQPETYEVGVFVEEDGIQLFFPQISYIYLEGMDELYGNRSNLSPHQLGEILKDLFLYIKYKEFVKRNTAHASSTPGTAYFYHDVTHYEFITKNGRMDDFTEPKS